MGTVQERADPDNPDWVEVVAAVVAENSAALGGATDSEIWAEEPGHSTRRLTPVQPCRRAPSGVGPEILRKRAVELA